MSGSLRTHRNRLIASALPLVTLLALALGACSSGTGNADSGSTSTPAPGPAPTSTGAPTSTRAPTTAAEPTASTGPSAELPSGSASHAITVDGLERTYLTYVPENLDRSEPAPLVVMLHGGFGSAEGAEGAYGWNAKADAEGFVVAYPDGYRRAWNAGTCCGAASRKDVDGVGFITEVVESVQEKASIDPRRIYVTGMSNGAMMSQRLACETDLFAAFASVAGAEMVPCEEPHPTSVLHIHGTADSNAPMDGSQGDGRGKVAPHTPVPESIAKWLEVNGCAAPSVAVEGPVRTATAACPHGRAVELTTVDGAGHQWPGKAVPRPRMRELRGADPVSEALDATAVIWSFFEAHPAPT